MSFQRTVAPGIEIRQLEEADAPVLFGLVDRDRDYLREWLPWVDRTHAAEDIGQYIAMVQAQLAENRSPNTAIVVDGAICGCIGCHAIDWANRKASIGYWIAAGHQRRGIMTQCCVAMLRYLFDELGLHRVEIRCGTGNTKSCAIPARLGFTREGTMRGAEYVDERWIDLVVWSMLEEEWRARG